MSQFPCSDKYDLVGPCSSTSNCLFLVACLPSAVVTVSSVHVLFASHYWTVRMFQQWGAYQYHKPWFFLISLMLMCSAFLSFFTAHVSYTLHHGFIHASRVFYHAYHTSHGHYLGLHGMAITESRPWSQIIPKVTAVAWYFFPKSCVDCILRKKMLFLLFFLHSLISKWIMDLNMLWLEEFTEGFIYTIQINRPCTLRGHQ